MSLIPDSTKLCLGCRELAEVFVSYGRWHAFYCDGCADDAVPKIEEDFKDVFVTKLDKGP